MKCKNRFINKTIYLKDPEDREAEYSVELQSGRQLQVP